MIILELDDIFKKNRELSSTYVPDCNVMMKSRIKDMPKYFSWRKPPYSLLDANLDNIL